MQHLIQQKRPFTPLSMLTKVRKLILGDSKCPDWGHFSTPRKLSLWMGPLNALTASMANAPGTWGSEQGGGGVSFIHLMNVDPKSSGSHNVKSESRSQKYDILMSKNDKILLQWQNPENYLLLNEDTSPVQKII